MFGPLCLIINRFLLTPGSKAMVVNRCFSGVFSKCWSSLTPEIEWDLCTTKHGLILEAMSVTVTFFLKWKDRTVLAFQISSAWSSPWNPWIMTVWVETILNSLGGNYGMKKPTTRTLSFQCLSISSQTVKKTGLFFFVAGCVWECIHYLYKYCQIQSEIFVYTRF